jgi:hypothetical protein
MYWRFEVTKPCENLLDWNCGPAGGGQLPGFKPDTIRNEGELVDGTQIIVVGAGARLNPSISAYIVFDGKLPDKVWFAVAYSPAEIPKTFLQVYPPIQ